MEKQSLLAYEEVDKRLGSIKERYTHLLQKVEITEITICLAEN